MPTEPDKAYLSYRMMKKTAYSINCHRVGRIIAFHKEDFTCDVELLEKATKSGGGYVEYAPLLQLPLIISGTDYSHITFSKIVGSECFVHFNDNDIDNWFSTGEKYTPNSTRSHSFSDGFVTLRPYSKSKVFSYYENGLEIKNGNTIVHLNDDGTIEITNGQAIINMTGSTIAITGDVTVSGKVTAVGEITSGAIELTQHKHGGVSSGNSNTGTPVTP